MIFQYKKLHDSAHDPIKHYADDACWDLCAHGEHIVKTYNTIPTGLVIDTPPGYYGMILSRSGLASKYGLFVLNAPGIIDAGYAGEIQIILGNISGHNWEIEDGERIAQLVFAPITEQHISRNDSLIIHSKRGAAGVGSTGR